ncbi:MAG: hypothetical protein MJ138_00375 [Kiritimatiellae bacterium]|nr:hypothetical protein [Kiritimatiellia bacterium]
MRKSLAFLACACAAVSAARADVVLETESFKLALGDDAKAKSLVLKANGEELLDPAQGVAFFAATQDRPFNNENKLMHPNKRTTYPANRVRRDGDRLVVGFELAPYEAVVRVKAGRRQLAFTLESWIAEKGPVVYGSWMEMNKPPVADFRLLQLPVKSRANFGDWLNCAWDDRGGVAVIGADPYADISHEDRARGKILFADLHRGIELLGGTAALVAGAGGGELLAGIEEVEEAFNLPRGVAARRSDKLNASIYWAGDVHPDTVDEHIAFAKKGGFRMMLMYYTCFLKGGWTYLKLGDYDWNEHFPNGASDLKKMLDKIRAAGITPGFHTLQTHVGMQSRYITPVCDPRLNLTRRFDLMRPIAATGTVDEIFVAQNPIHAMKSPKARFLRFGGELFSYEDYTTTPPYRFTGVKRGAWGTTPTAHARGEGGGTLDLSEYGATSCYVDQNTDLQDEIAAKIAKIVDCGMEFCYFDGSEGAPPPCNVNVSLAQWRTCRAFAKPPLFTEGAAKTHFGWHLQAGANAFDIFRPEEFKRRIVEFPLTEAPMMRQNFTRLDFGWWGMWNPGPGTMGVQADLWEFGTSKAAAWDCPAAIQVNLDVLRRHPRMNDILETMRRWEDVRARKWLTPAQKELLKDPKREFHLYLNDKGEYELVEIALVEGVAGGKVRAFVFERNGRRTVAHWHVDGAGTLALPRPLAGDAKELAVGNRRYAETDLTVPEIVAILKEAKLK